MNHVVRSSISCFCVRCRLGMFLMADCNTLIFERLGTTSLLFSFASVGATGFVRGCNCFSIYTMYHRENRTEETNHHTRMSSFVQEDPLKKLFCYVLISPCRTMACKEKLVQTAGSPSPQNYQCYLCVISIYLMYIYISCIYRDTCVYIYILIL